MGILEWLAVTAFIFSGFLTYRKQEYWLDRQIAKAIRWLKSKLFSK